MRKGRSVEWRREADVGPRHFGGILASNSYGDILSKRGHHSDVLPGVPSGSLCRALCGEKMEARKLGLHWTFGDTR